MASAPRDPARRLRYHDRSASDHETRVAEEAWEKLKHGLFLQLRDEDIERAIPLFVKHGLKDWSNISLVTDDRDVAVTVKQGTMNRRIKLAIQTGAPAEAAYAMASLYPARHAHMDPVVGSIAPGRYADVVLLSSVNDVAIKYVFANRQLAAQDGKYLLPVPKIAWPAWASDTIHIGRPLVAKDFEILAPPGRTPPPPPCCRCSSLRVRRYAPDRTMRRSMGSGTSRRRAPSPLSPRAIAHSAP